ncbi:MAG: SdrD B-like domain-containing protein, partial [Methanothrix sp.]
MRAQGSTTILAHEIRGKSPIDGALASSIRRCFSDLLTLILLGTVLLGSLCIAGNAADYYSGQKYRFGTVYSPNWDYLWDAGCCSDNTKPCCFDPAKAHQSTFEITAPIVDEPTEITISVMVRTKRIASCMDMAELKITVKPLKGLTVVKKHLGGDGTFPFTGTGFSGDCDMNSFSLTPSNGYAFACPNLLPGTYTIAELVPPGWDLDGITVAGTDPAYYRIADNTVTIKLQPNEAPVITFTDKKRCSLTVAKKAIGGDAAFSFTGEGFPTGCTLESFQLKNGESASDQSLISGRAYTISEGALGGWDLESITVTGTDPANCQITGRSITITPQPGETPAVTFTNAKRGSIVVDKVASPGGSAQEFEFKPSYGEPFKLSDASDPKDSDPLLPSTYSIIETAAPDWDLTDITVEGITSEPAVDLVTGTISFYLASGETARVTYTNRKKQADISGIVWDDANGNCILDEGEDKLSGWTVTLKDASSNVIATDTTDEHGAYEFENVAPGKYNLQTTLQPGWAPTCPPEGKVEIDRTSIPIVQSFGNRRSGSITVIKDAIPNGRQPFDFTGTLGKFELIDDGTTSNRIVFTSLKAGDYEIKELVPAGWSLISVDCTGCPSDPIEGGVIVHLSEGGSATVRFVDIAAVGGLSLNKSTQNKTVALGQDILYTITLCNDGPVSLTNVTLWDMLPESVELVDVYPEPASYCHWTIGT